VSEKINALNPKVDICLNSELPTPSLKEIAVLAYLASKVNSEEEALMDKPDEFFKEKHLNLSN